MFPFVTPLAEENPERLLRAVAFQFKLWEDEADPELNCQLCFLLAAVISAPVRQLSIEVEDYRSWEKMRAIGSVLTKEELVIVMRMRD